MVCAAFEMEKMDLSNRRRARLHVQCRKAGIEMRRAAYSGIDELFKENSADVYFNCSGLGSYSLKGVVDKQLYPTRVCLPMTE